MKPDYPSSRIAGLILIAVATFVLHGHVLDRFWLGDDPQVVLHAIRYEPLEIVMEPEAWRELSGSNFTPLVTWSFDLDLSLFGADPQAFYVHQLLAIALCAALIRILMLALGHDRRIALLTALLFLASPAVVHVAGTLMTRHYVEGLAAALVAFLAWGWSARRVRDWAPYVAGPLLYLIALLAKEVYVLLPAVFFAMSWRREQGRRWMVRLVPYLAVLLAYLGWRGWILGGAGGYGERNPIMHFFTVATAWLAHAPLVAGSLLVLLVIAAGALARSWTGSVRFVAVSVATIAPLVGVGDAIEARHLLVPAVVVLIAAVHGVSRLRGREAGGSAAGSPSRAMLVVVIVLATIVGGVQMFRSETAAIERMQAEGRYVWEEAKSAAPLLATSPGWYLDGVREIDGVLRGESSPPVFYSPLGLALETPKKKFVSFDEHGGPIVKDSPMVVDRESYEPSLPITLEIERRDRALRWNFEPECECEWRFYSYPDYQMFVVPPNGERVVPRPRETQWFRIERRDSDGTWTMSAPLKLPSEGESIRWSRSESGKDF